MSTLSWIISIQSKIKKEIKKIEKIFDQAKLKVTKKDNWGKRKLAYPIKRQAWGIYIFYQVEAAPESVVLVQANLRIAEEVMRFLVVSLEKHRLIHKPKPAKAGKAKPKKAKSAVSDEKDKE